METLTVFHIVPAALHTEWRPKRTYTAGNRPNQPVHHVDVCLKIPSNSFPLFNIKIKRFLVVIEAQIENYKCTRYIKFLRTFETNWKWMRIAWTELLYWMRNEQNESRMFYRSQFVITSVTFVLCQKIFGKWDVNRIYIYRLRWERFQRVYLFTEIYWSS